jgi:hypothetical protein
MIAKLRRFLDLGVIIGTLPYTIQDGDLIDAVPVQGNFDYIVSQVNANAAAGNVINAASIPTFVPAASVGGTANAITLAPIPTISAYSAGQRFSFPAQSNNTSAVTIATNGLSARALRYADGTALTGSELLAGGVYDIEDNGSYYVLMNASQGSNIISWSPTLTFGAGNTGITYGTQTGTAIKYGRMVYASFDIILTSKGSSSGQAIISGLPFPSNSGWFGDNAGPVAAANLTISGKYVMFGYINGTSTMNLLMVTSAGSLTALDDTAFANTTQIAGFGVYPT